MKLGELNTAIRTFGGAVKVRVAMDALEVSLDVQKTSLLDELKRLFPDGRAQETGLFLRKDGYLMLERQRQ